VIAFQSQGGQQRAALPLDIAPAPVIDLDSSWSSSENAFTPHSAFEGVEQDTGDSRASKNSKV
jgi:BRCA1/BRCA2-containing complex subunit 3